MKPTKEQYRAVVSKFKHMSDSRQHETAMNGLNSSEEQFEDQIYHGNFDSIQQAHKVREANRKLVEDHFGAPVYNPRTKRWE